MSRTPLTLAVTLTILFVAPFAGAKWMSYGTYEPDTIYDTAQFMTQDGPGTARNSTIYFNAYPKNMCVGGANGCWINPNSGALETDLDPLGTPRTYQVIMGVWTDCNGDGYVGLAETAAMEYSARVLTSPASPINNVGVSVCPAQSGGNPPASTYAAKGMPNNYNGWVTEFLHIGGVDYSINDDARVFFDRDAMVWAEPGIPDAPVGTPRPETACDGRQRGPDNAQEQGDAHTIGGILWAADCQGNADYGTNKIGPVPAQPVPLSIVKTFNTVATASGNPSLGFGTDPKNSTSPLNAKLGSENADGGGVIVKAQDCGSAHYGPEDNEPGDPETFNTRTLGLPPQASDVDDLTLLRPVPANPVNTNPSTWSVPATVNYTVESKPETPGGPAGPGPGDESDCNFDNDPGHDFYDFFEGNPQVEQETGKVSATSNFRFITEQRGADSAFVVSGGSAGAHPQLGLTPAGSQCADSGCTITQWTGGITTPQPIVSRPLVDALVGQDIAFPSAPYVTFYGYIGPNLTGWAKPAGGGQYGKGPNSCGSATSGTVNNWQCDKNLWYRSADGNEITVRPVWCQERPCRGYGEADVSTPRAKVGQAISFRDVDCIDGRVGSTGLGTMPAYFGTKCDRPADH